MCCYFFRKGSRPVRGASRGMARPGPAGRSRPPLNGTRRKVILPEGPVQPALSPRGPQAPRIPCWSVREASFAGFKDGPLLAGREASFAGFKDGFARSANVQATMPHRGLPPDNRPASLAEGSSSTRVSIMPLMWPSRILACWMIPAWASGGMDLAPEGQKLVQTIAPAEHGFPCVACRMNLLAGHSSQPFKQVDPRWVLIHRLSNIPKNFPNAPAGDISRLVHPDVPWLGQPAFSRLT
jgi:hypothetical protein